eukprot:6784325-Pyramimonas_sp.AAC.1
MLEEELLSGASSHRTHTTHTTHTTRTGAAPALPATGSRQPPDPSDHRSDHDRPPSAQIDDDDELVTDGLSSDPLEGGPSNDRRSIAQIVDRSID